MAKAPRTIQVYKSYNFKDKDPVIDLLRGPVNETGLTYSSIAAESGVSAATISNWFNGATRRPQFATLNAVARAIGYELYLRKRKP